MTSSYPLFPGDGTAPFIEEIVRGVAACGHEVDVVLPAHPRLQRPAEGGVRFFPFDYAPVASWRVWGYAQSLKADRGFRWRTLAVAPFAALATRRAVSKRLTNGSYDLVHAHWVIPGGVLSRAAARSANKPLVLSLHGSDVFAAERNAAFAGAARRAFEDASVVTACSGDLRDRAIRLGAAEARTHIVPYGVDAEFFGSTPMPPEERAAVRARLGAPGDATLVVAVGRLVEKKGFRHFVDAIQGTELRGAIVGDGDLEAGLREQISRSNAPVTLAGRFSRTEIRDALHAADIVVVPSVIDSNGNVDGLPNALLEAMAAGRPIVASRVAGIPDVVTDGVDGTLVAAGDATSLREALLRVARDPDRGRIGEAARLRVMRDLTWDRLAATFERLYVQAQTLAKR